MTLSDKTRVDAIDRVLGRILEDLGERVFDELRFEVEAERYREIPHTTWLELEALGHVEADHAIGSAGYRLTAAGWIASLRGTGKLDSQREWAVTLRTALKDVVKGRPLNGAITDFPVFTDLSTAVERSERPPSLAQIESDGRWPTSVSAAACVRHASRGPCEGRL